MQEVKKRKAKGVPIDRAFLRRRTSKRHGKQKWIQYCEYYMDRGCTVLFYEAKKTVSKYITIVHVNKMYRVRFSNHAPIKKREERGDCDFFVGHTNFEINTMLDAIKATNDFFRKE